MKKILFAASEGVPFIKTGGLAHVYLSACWTDFWLLQRMPHSVGERML